MEMTRKTSYKSRRGFYIIYIMKTSIRKICKAIFLGSLGLVVVALTISVGLKILIDNACINTTLEKLQFKNAYQAVLFSRDCGAITGLYYHVSIMKGRLKNTSVANVFISDAGKPPTLSITPAGELVIHYSLIHNRVYKREYKKYGIQVTYAPQ